MATATGTTTPTSSSNGGTLAAGSVTPGTTIVVHITDKTGHSLSGATITVAGQTNQTDHAGNATFVNPPDGTQTVKITYHGSTKSTAITVEGGSTAAAPQNFTLVASTSGSATSTILVGLIVLLGVAGGSIRGAFWWTAKSGQTLKLKTIVAATLILFGLVVSYLLVAGLLL